MDWLIDTKLAPPAAFGPTVPRRYAEARLRDALAGHATLVVAPAGYGKTELLARWYQQCRDDGLRVGWISLEPEDAQIEVFLDYALAALGQAGPASASTTPASRRAATSRLLAATLADERRTLLFLDDVERLGGALDDLLRLLIERASPRLHLVIASRVLPDIGLAELRAKRVLAELGPADLRLGFQEAQALLASGSRPVTEGDVALLLQRTEGWPIALRMAGDFVQSHPDAAAPLTAFSGRVDELATYLYEAILRTLPADEQQALMALACVPRVCGELLNRLADRRDGGDLLQRFARRNVLLSRLEGEAPWYRLHPLLAEFLRARLAQVDADAPRRVHRLAAAWFAQARLLPEALRAASAAGDAHLLAGLLDRAGGWRLVVDGRVGLLRAHLDDIDDSTLLRHPRLAMARPMLLAKSATRWLAATWLERVRQACAGFTDPLDSAGPAYDAAQLALEGPIMDVVVRWYLDDAPPGGFAGDIQALMARADPQADPLLAATVGNLLCYERQCLRRHRAAWDAAAQALQALEGATFPDQDLYLRLIQIGILTEQVRLPEALALARQTQARAEAACGLGSDLAAVAEVLLARVLALQGDASGANELLDRALPQVQEQDAWFDILWAGHAARAGAAVLAGDEAAVQAVLERGLALAERRRLPRLSARLQVHRIERLLPRGAVAHATDLAEALGLAALPARFETVDRRIADAAWLAQWRLDLAGTHGARARAGAAATLAARVDAWADEGSALQAIEGLLLLAGAQALGGDGMATAHALDRALSLAVPAQALLPFIELGPGLDEAFDQALLRSGGRGAPNLRARFLATVLDSLRRPAAAPARHPQGLSPREREIARLLALGYSNKLIGRELALSEGTVKFHLRNLYTKLGVHGREDALRRLSAAR
ncbi:LuxR C-terminal-related transcriptional regulator [Pseudorhodoferax sp.]|uniref:LuxR C-terminal-related transcriptional regulator n=1 Tax=Pseudorhodoferax sp. TaxID=1993553 RepID=UPI002DD62E05|nr:LuxR C-terminal-related transcriptional regulator [Pseudorhodoferax sp.]